MGIQIPAEARVLIKDGIPQAAMSILILIKLIIGVHIQIIMYKMHLHQFGTSQLNTGINSDANCVPATTKMLLNMKGLMKEKSVEALSSEGLREVNNYKMLDYLQPYGYLGKLIMGSSDVIKQYLDWGNVVTVPTVIHQRLCIGYATRNGKTWFEVLDPEFTDFSKGHQWIEEKMIAVGFAITDTNKVNPFTVDYTDNNGISKQAIAYYNNYRLLFTKVYNK